MAIISQGALLPAPSGFAEVVSPLAGTSVYGPDDSMRLLSSMAWYGAIYKRQVWVGTLVNKIAYGAARLPLKVYRRTGAGREEDRRSGLGELVRKPNPQHDPFFFWLWTFSTFEVFGEALWVKQRPAPGRPPIALWPLHPSNVTVERTGDELIYRWQHSADASLTWPARDVVHFRSYNPEQQARGLSRLEPLRSTLTNEDAIQRAQTAHWRNGARPSVILSHPKQLSRDAQSRVKASWDASHSGVDSWSKAAILEEGMTATPLELRPEQMQMIESRHVNREEACAIYDVPPPVVHILDRATFSNITEQMRSMYRDTMAPRLALYESVLRTQLASDFDPSGDLYPEFLMDAVLRGSFEARTEAYQRAIQSGWMKPGEVRTLENLPDAGPEADRLYVNGAIVPMTAAEEGAPDASEQRAARGIDNAARRTLMGRLGTIVSVHEINLFDLTCGLDEDIAQVVVAHVNAARSRGDSVANLRRALTGELMELEGSRE